MSKASEPGDAGSAAALLPAGRPVPTSIAPVVGSAVEEVADPASAAPWVPERRRAPRPGSQTTDCLLLLDAQQRIVALNAGAQHWLDGSSRPVVGAPFATLFPASSRSEQRRRLTQTLALEAPLDAPASLPGCTLMGAGGNPVSVDLALAGLKHTPMYAVFFSDPATANSPAPAPDWPLLLRRFQTVVELAPIAIWIAQDDQVMFANSAALRLFGAPSQATLVGRSVRAMIRPDAHRALEQQISTVLTQPGQLGNVQATLLRHDGVPCQVEIALTALPDHGRTTLQMVVHDVTQRQREIRELESSRQALRRLSANMVEGREAERQRISRELHDELGQSLSVLQMELIEYMDHGEGAADAAPDRRRALSGMVTRLDDIMKSVRRIAADLRPLMLDELGPGPAIEWLVQDFSRRTGLHCELQLDDIGTLANHRAATALYRMVQEALTNVVRHAHATQVSVQLQRGSDHLLLTVCDNGVGLPERAQHRDSHFGLLGMQERADMLGGDFKVAAQPGGGTCVRMRMPLEPAAPDDIQGVTP